MSPLLRTADDFVQVVKRELTKDRHCILYETAFSPLTASPDKIWPEMGDATFRASVLRALPQGVFSPPDDLDEWVFTMVRGHYPSAVPPALRLEDFSDQEIAAHRRGHCSKYCRLCIEFARRYIAATRNVQSGVTFTPPQGTTIEEENEIDDRASIMDYDDFFHDEHD